MPGGISEWMVSLLRINVIKACGAGVSKYTKIKAIKEQQPGERGLTIFAGNVKYSLY
jgi:hypothetical protein